MKKQINRKKTMHIKSVKFENHDILGNLELNFCNADGTPNNTIIIAGGNGIGKSVILEAINNSISTINQKVKYEFHFSEQSKRKAELSVERMYSVKIKACLINFDDPRYYFNLTYEDGRVFLNNFDRSQLFHSENKNYFFPASLHFDSQTVQSVTNRNEDMSPTSKIFNEAIAKDINQTLVDIRAVDNRDVVKFARENPSSPIPVELIDARTKKFKECFDTFFDGKSLVLNPNKNTNIEFEENGKTFPIQNLSTGEKQIVYRAGSMLAHKTALTGNIVLFDEPEISMHPEWQTKIVPFYRELLGEDTQIIIATHSPFIIHGTPFAKKIIIQKDAKGKREVMQQPKFYNFNETEAVYGFDLSSLLKDATPVQVLVEGKTDKTILETAWNKLYSEPCPFSFVDMEGAQNLNSFLNHYKVTSEQKIIGLFDFDSVYGQWNGAFKKSKVSKTTDIQNGLLNKHSQLNCWAALLPVPSHRELFASEELAGNSYFSIEFLFEDTLIGNQYLLEKTSQTGQKYNVINDSKNLKTDFSNNVNNFNQSDFKHFIPVFNLLKGIKDGLYD